MSSSEAAAVSASRGRTCAGSAWPLPPARVVSTSATSGSDMLLFRRRGWSPLRTRSSPISRARAVWDVQNGSWMRAAERHCVPLRRSASHCANTVKTKSRRGVRVVPFLPVVAETLASHLQSELQEVADMRMTSSSARATVAPSRARTSRRGGSRKRVCGLRLGEGIRAQVLRGASARSCPRTPDLPIEGAALTGRDEQTWWRSYVQPRRDAESRHGIVSRLTARGIGVRPEVDQRLTDPS